MIRTPVLAAIRLYQHLMAGRLSPCRFIPSCSTYAAEAVEAHGAITGLWLALRRLARCHPWGGQGYDPVPPVKESHSALRQPGACQHTEVHS